MGDLNLATKLFILALLLLSTAFHEMAHAFVATWLGDPTPGRAGRLTMNPIPHLSPVFSAVLLPVIMMLANQRFMILASCPVNPSYFKNPLRDDALVAIAGPLTNVLCALVLIVFLWIPGLAPDGSISWVALRYSIFLNFLMAVFNMIPIPPLDGSHIIRMFLPFSVRRTYDDFAKSGIGFMLVFAVGWYVLPFFYAPISTAISMLTPS